MKKRLIALFTLLSTTVLASCSSNTTVPTTNPTTTSVTSSVEPSTTTIPSTNKTDTKSNTEKESEKSTTTQTNKKQYKVNFDEIGNYVANISCASSIGVMQKEITKLNSYSNGIKLLADDKETSNHLYITTYDNPNASVNDGLIEVTFKRIITDSVSTNITGNEKYMSFIEEEKEYVSFPSVNSFTYKISKDGFLLEGITDNDNNDLDKNEGIIKIKVDEASIDNDISSKDTKDKLYNVEYTGVGVEEIVTQDEIGGQIDNLYVDTINNVTYISYIPKDSKVESTEKFYSDSSRQSFIINNNTGLIYKIEGVTITQLSCGLIKCSDDLLYDFRINDKNEYELYPLYGNKDIMVGNWCKDRNGIKYLFNSILETFDTNTNTKFLNYSDMNTKYYYSKEGYMLLVENSKNYYVLTGKDSKREINENDYITIVKFYSNNYIGKEGIIRDGYIYKGNNKLTVSSIDGKYVGPSEDIHMEYALYDGEYIAENCLDYLLDYGITFELVNGTVYCYTDFLNEYINYIKDKENGMNPDSDFLTKEVVFENVNSITRENGIATIGAFGTTYYEIVVTKDETGNVSYKAYVKGTYEAPAKTIVLQPINR